MAHRFHCEQCGKRLQVDLMPGAEVLCPYCRNAQIVPADAVLMTSPAATHPADDEPEDPSRTDNLVAVAANYIPSWGTSVVLHLAVALIALMGAWASVRPPLEVLTVDANFVKAPPKAIHTPRISRPPHKAESKNTSSFKYEPTENPMPDLANHLRPPTMTIGLPDGYGGYKTGGMSGIGDFRGPVKGYEDGDGWFDRGAARQVFVIDRSGSMTDSIMYVKYELKRTIRSMTPRDQFHVIFYSTGPAMEMPTMKLIPALETNKQLACDFIDGIIPVGGTDPSDALKAAFRLKPEVIHLLSDGEFEPKIVNLIDKLNAKKEVAVNVLCFIYPTGEPMLQEIAHRNGGTYRYISDDDAQAIGSHR